MIKKGGPKIKPQKQRIFVVANHQINFPQLRVMDEKGSLIGILSKNEAIDLAYSQDKDLVLITDKANPPVAKIIEFSKYKYQLSQKQANDRRNNRAQDIKEIRLKPFIGENDLLAKLKKAQEFIKKNHKVRLSMELRGRAITKQELAHQILNRFVQELSAIAQTEVEPKLLGKKIQLQLMPKKKQK